MQVTTPVVKIEHGKGSYTAIYILRDKTQKFRMPGVNDDSPRAWDYGPSLIVERVCPQFNDTVTYHPDDPKPWEWLGALMGVGAYVMNNEELAAKVPEKLKRYWK